MIPAVPLSSEAAGILDASSRGLSRGYHQVAATLKKHKRVGEARVKHSETGLGFSDAGTLLALSLPRAKYWSPADPMLLHQYMNGALDVMHPTALQKDTTFTKIFVGGLPYHTNDASLRKYFEAFGDIDEAVVITDRQTGKSRGYGFVSRSKTFTIIRSLSRHLAQSNRIIYQLNSVCVYITAIFLFAAVSLSL